MNDPKDKEPKVAPPPEPPVEPPPPPDPLVGDSLKEAPHPPPLLPEIETRD